uniref:Uncharacterized protein LOC103501503 isoform X2 n=1 Tax=Rhizophora mucronata TaxID=61149 RepID=A0A2P2LY47_RHIMU
MSPTRATSALAWLETTNSFGIIHILHFSRRSYATRWTVYLRLWNQCNLQPKLKNDRAMLVQNDGTG